MSETKTLAAIGCSGPIGRIFVDGFLKAGANVRLLARNADEAAKLHPGAEVIHGSMMNPGDVASATASVDAAFLCTPMGLRNDPTNEVAAARVVLAGLKASGLKHLIYLSVLGADTQRGVGILDAKYEIERLIAASGVPYTILRCGSYMEDVFDSRLPMLRKGRFLFPVNKARRFTYTCQQDVAPFVLHELLDKGRILNRPINFVSPGVFALHEVESLLSAARGAPVAVTPKFPAYYLFLAALPYFNWKGHRFSSIIPLIRYFDRWGYTATGDTVGDLFPDFRSTPLEAHLRALFSR